MADNSAIKSDASTTLFTAAADEVTYSGDTTKVQIVRLVHVAGTEGSKTLTEIASATQGIRVNTFGATSTLSNVNGSTSSVTVLASNTARLKAWLYNDSTALAYVKFGATASTSSFTKLMSPSEFLPIEGYTGVIDAIWASATGAMRITELTA